MGQEDDMQKTARNNGPVYCGSLLHSWIYSIALSDFTYKTRVQRQNHPNFNLVEEEHKTKIVEMQLHKSQAHEGSPASSRKWAWYTSFLPISLGMNQAVGKLQIITPRPHEAVTLPQAGRSHRQAS